MKRTNYFDFFNSYRVVDIKDDTDLIYQVGWSKNNEPLSKEVIDIITGIINIKLDLQPEDKILDFCCGNGIISYELSKKVAYLIGIDFSQAYIENANLFKKNNNITYHFGSVNDFEMIISVEILQEYRNSAIKILMSNSLGYFDEKSLTTLLIKLNDHFRKFKFYITGIPNLDKKNIIFPNKLDQLKFILNDRILKKTKGIGRFWKKNELINIAQKFSLTYIFDNDFDVIPGQNYRFNLLLEKK